MTDPILLPCSSRQAATSRPASSNGSFPIFRARCPPRAVWRVSLFRAAADARLSSAKPVATIAPSQLPAWQIGCDALAALGPGHLAGGRTSCQGMAPQPGSSRRPASVRTGARTPGAGRHPQLPCAAGCPSAARLVTPSSRIPHGTMPAKCSRSGSTFRAEPVRAHPATQPHPDRRDLVVSRPGSSPAAAPTRRRARRSCAPSTPSSPSASITHVSSACT